MKNVNRVLKTIEDHLNKRGLSVVSSHSSNREDSDSTYYDIDLRITNPNKDIDFLYFRVADHHISQFTDEQSIVNYYNRMTRSYENLPKNEDVSGKWAFYPIIVDGKRFNNFDRAMNHAKELIDEKLVIENIIDGDLI